jgi:hypothetical protein
MFFPFLIIFIVFCGLSAPMRFFPFIFQKHAVKSLILIRTPHALLGAHAPMDYSMKWRRPQPLAIVAVRRAQRAQLARWLSVDVLAPSTLFARTARLALRFKIAPDRRRVCL